MVVTLKDLLQGTQKIHPQAIEWAPDGNNAPLFQLDIQPFKGINNVVISSKQHYSGRWGIDTHREITKSGIYSQRIRFSLTGNRKAGKDKPVSSRDRALCSCTCSNYYYMFFHSNRLVKAHDGANFKKYVRKTPPPPAGRPFVNPHKIPGMCKHLVYLMRFLRSKRKIQ